MSREALESELKKLLVTSLMLEGQSPEDIDSETPLFIDGLGLDSIDALELGMAVSKRYGVEIDSANEDMRNAFRSIKTLAEFVENAKANGGQGEE